MPLRGPVCRRQSSCWAPILLLLAIAAIGVGGAHKSAAQPIGLVKDLIKKKQPDKKQPAKAKTEAKPGSKTLPGLPGRIDRSLLPGSKQAIPGSKQLVPGSKAAPATGALTKGPDPKGALTKGPDIKAATATLPKGASPKNTISALPKGTTAALPKGLDKRGPIASLAPKAISPKGGFAAPRFAATAPERLRLRSDHRLALFAAQRLLPPRPLPGERGFTGVPPAGETRFVSTELVLRIGPGVSRQTLDDTARRLGLVTISTQDAGIAGGTIYHFRLAGGANVTNVVRALEAQNIGVAQPNYTYRLLQDAEPDAEPATEPAGAGTETAASEQYVVDKLNLAEAHKIATGKNVLIAVIDSMIDVKHPDLAGAI